MPSKKKYNARFPPARIKKIMQTDEDVGKVAAPVPVLISKALEIFLESLITKSSQQTRSRSAKTMSTAHIKQCIQSESTFDFLKDLVENVPDISQGDEEDSENHHHHSSAAAVSNNNNSSSSRHAGGISRSNSTASSSSVTDHVPQKRRRGRPRKNPEDRAGPSRSRKRSQVVTQSSEDRTTSEDSDLSETDMIAEDRKPQSIPTISVSQAGQEIRSPPSMSWPMPQQQQQHHQQQQPSHHQPPPSHGIPVMPQFHVPTAPSNPPHTAAMMGLYQMPKATSSASCPQDDDDDEDDYDT